MNSMNNVKITKPMDISIVHLKTVTSVCGDCTFLGCREYEDYYCYLFNVWMPTKRDTIDEDDEGDMYIDRCEKCMEQFGCASDKDEADGT